MDTPLICNPARSAPAPASAMTVAGVQALALLVPGAYAQYSDAKPSWWGADEVAAGLAVLAGLVVLVAVSWVAGFRARRLLSGIWHPAWLLAAVAASVVLYVLGLALWEIFQGGGPGTPVPVLVAFGLEVVAFLPLYVLCAYFTLALARAECLRGGWVPALHRAAWALVGLFVLVDAALWVAGVELEAMQTAPVAEAAAKSVVAAVAVSLVVWKVASNMPRWGVRSAASQPPR